MSNRKRRNYTPEFETEVVELVRQADKSLSQICRDMDLMPSAVKNWVDKADQQTQQVSETGVPERKSFNGAIDLNPCLLFRRNSSRE